MFLIPASKFIKFAEYAKLLKSSLVFINDGVISGIDNNQCCIKSLDINETFNEFNLVCYGSHLPGFIKNICFTDILSDSLFLDYSSMRIYHPKNPDNYLQLLNPNVYNAPRVVNNEINKANNIIEYGSIKTDEKFLECINMKSIEGMKMYNRDCYFMSIFCGLLPINKSDDVHLTIYDIDNYSYISKFSIHKKKGVILNVYIRYMKFNR